MLCIIKSFYEEFIKNIEIIANNPKIKLKNVLIIYEILLNVYWKGIMYGLKNNKKENGDKILGWIIWISAIDCRKKEENISKFITVAIFELHSYQLG